MTVLGFRSALGMNGAPLQGINTFVDTFDTINPAVWSTVGTVSSVGGRLRVSCDPTYPAITSVASYSLIGTSIRVEAATIVPYGNGSTASYWSLYSDLNPGTRDGIQITAVVGTDGVVGISVDWFSNGTDNYIGWFPNSPPETARWWQIRESAGTVYIEISPDESTWSTITTIPTATLTAGGVNLDALHVQFSAGYWGTESTGLYAEFDNLNVTVHDKSGSGVPAAAGSGAKSTINVKTGSGVAGAAASGPKTTTAPAVRIKTGSGVALSAGSGPKVTVLPTVAVKTGSAVAAVASSGAKATTISKTGSGATRATGVGARQTVIIVGKTTPGSTILASSTDKIGVSSAVAPSSGVLSTAHAHIWLSAAGSTPARFVVYTDNGGAPGAPVALSDEITVTALADTVADFTFSGAQQTLITGGNTYWFGPFWKDPGVPSVNIGRDGVAGGRYENSTAVYPTPANPFVPTGAALAGPLAAWFEMVPMPAGATIDKSGGAAAAGSGSGAKAVVTEAYVLDRVTGAGNTPSFTHTITPPGTTTPGDLILVAFTNDTATSVASTNSPDWQMLGSLAQGTTTNHRGSIFAKRATGSDTLVVDLTESQEATWVALRVGAAGDPLIATPLTGSGTPYNLPAFTGDPNDYLAICTVHMDSSADTTLAQAITFPSGFANVTSRNPTVTSSGATFTAERLYTGATTITPGTFSPTVGEQWVSFTIAIPPLQTGIIKRGSGVASGSGSGARTRTTATTITKTGSGVAGGIASGSKIAAAPSIAVKTGAGVSAGAGSGARIAVTPSVSIKTGAGVARVVGSGAKSVIRVKTGASAAAIAGSGARATTAPTVSNKTGSAVARGAGAGAKVSTTTAITLKTGSAAARGAASGARALTRVDTGSAVARGAGSGAKQVTIARAGGAVTAAAGTGSTAAGWGMSPWGTGGWGDPAAVNRDRTGAGTAAATGSGAKAAVAVTIINKTGAGVASVAGTGTEVRAGMPRVVARASGATTGNVLTHPITLPPNIAPGNVLIVLFSVDSNKIVSTSNTDWELVGVYSNGSNCSGALFTKIATGNDALTVTTSGSEESTHISLRAEFASGIRALAANGSSGAPPDAPTLVMVQSNTYYSILGVSIDASTDAANIITPSAGYTNLTTQPTATVQGAISATAEQAFTGTTMNPLPWSLSTSEQWVAWHIMLIPVGGSAAMILARGGEGAAAVSGSGTKATAATTAVDKTGAGVAGGVGSGARTSTAPAVVVKTGSATGRGAGSGARATGTPAVAGKTGAAVAGGAGSGARVVVRIRSGAGVAAGAGSGAKLVVSVATNVKTGSGAARAAASGAKSVITLTKSGGGVAGAAGIGTRVITGPFFSVIKTGSGVAGGMGAGSQILTRPSIRNVTGSALAAGVGSGTRAFRYDRTGAAAAGGYAVGSRRYIRGRTGGAVAGTAGIGARTTITPISKTGSGTTKSAGTGSKTTAAAAPPPVTVTPATVRARTTGAANVDATSHAINLPTATAQDLLLVAFSNDTATAAISTTDIGWQVLVTDVNGTTTNLRGTVLWKRATGSDSLTVNLSTAEAATWAAMSVINGADPVAVIANGSLAAGQTAITPPPITPAHGIDDYLSIVTVHTDSSTTTAQAVTPPANYTNLQSINPTVTTSAATFTMERALTDVATITPGALALGVNEQYVVTHVAIAPLASSTGGTTTGLAAPTNVTATWSTTGPKVTLNWTPTPGSDSTQVHEFNADPANTLKATLAYPTGTRVSGTLVNGFTYAYAVRAVRGTEVSPWSIVINISNTGQSVGQPPAASAGLSPPTNFASVMDAAKVVNSTWTPTLGSDSTEVHEFLVDPTNTLKATIPYPGGSRTAGPLAGGREYLYAVRAVKGADISTWSNAVRILADGTSQPDVVPGTAPSSGGGTSGGGGATPTVPGDLVDLSKWELTLPTGTAGNPTDIYSGDTPDLRTFSDGNYFRVGQDSSGRWYVEFLAPVNGPNMATTSSSSGATRSELRAMVTPNGGPNGAREAWSFDDGVRHEMTATVTADPTSIVNGRKEGIIGQIHGATGTPPVYLAANFNGTPKITLFKNGPTFADILTDITTTTKISYRFVKTETNRLQFSFALGDVSSLPATPQYDWPSSDFTDNTGCYFKVGAYNKTQLDDPDATGVFATRLYYLTLDGVGWKTQAPTTGGGGSTTTIITRTAGVGGIPAPAAAENVELNTSNRGAMNITASGTATVPRIYDGGKFTCGAVVINADNIIFQNYNIRPGSQYGVYITGDNVTVQNCDIANVRVSGDGDLNAFTVFGNNNKILYNTANNFVSGDPGGSHTDAFQTWVSNSHPDASANLQIIGNVFTGPANPSRNNSIPSIHQCVMAEGLNRGGNSGGSGDPHDWLILDNTFGGSWGQEIKLDGIDNVQIARNKFIGSSDVVMAVTSASNNVKFYSDNQVGSGYGSIGYTVTAGAGPDNPYNQITVTTPTTPTTPTAPTTPTTPGEALWIGTPAGRNHYNVGIAVSTTTHTDFSQTDIGDGFSNQWFKLSPDKLWVVFIARIDGATTSSGTKYARSELRELTESGANAAWNGGDSGVHRHKHISMVMHVPPNKPSVCFTQVHDASSDLARVQTEANGSGYKIVMRNTPPGSSTETVRTLVSNYAMGGVLDCSWMLSNGTGQFTLNGTTWTFPSDTTGCYFKTGAYAQTNETIDDASETCEVWVKAGSMQTWHTGYTTPTVAPWTIATPTTPTTPGTGTTGTVIVKTGGAIAQGMATGLYARATAGGYAKTGGGFSRAAGIGFRIRAHVKVGGGAARGAGIPIRRIERIRGGAAVSRGAGTSGAKAVVNVIPIVRMSGRATATSSAGAHVKNVRVIRRYVGAVASITGEPKRHGIMRGVRLTANVSAQPYLINPRLQKPLYAQPVVAQATATGRLHRVAKLYRAKAVVDAYASRSHLERVTRFRRVVVTADAIAHRKYPPRVDTTGFVVADARSRVYRYVAKMRAVARADTIAVGNLIKAPRRHVARIIATATGNMTPIRRMRGTTLAHSQLMDVQIRVVRHLTSIIRYLDEQQSVGDVTVEAAAVPESVEPEIPVYVYEQPFTVLRR